MLKKFGLLMLTMFCGLALSAGQKVTDKGYSALLSFRRDAVKDGSILVKDKVFKLELKSGQYIFTLFDKDGKVAAELRAAADAKLAQTIVVVLERLNERAQGLDGYRPILFVNGKRVSETERTTLALAADTSADPVVTGDIQFKEHSRMVSNQEIRTFSGIVISRRWRPSTDGAVLLENDGNPDTPDFYVAGEVAADGEVSDLLIVPGGGSAMPATVESVEGKFHTIKMGGPKTFQLAVTSMVSACRNVLEKSGVSADEVVWAIPHQANRRIIDAVANKLGIPEKVYLNVDRFGNTSSASIGICLDELNRAGKIKKGDLILTASFGAGLTWAALLIRW